MKASGTLGDRRAANEETLLSSVPNSPRREMMAALAALSVGGTFASGAQGGEARSGTASGARTLVAYFSRSCNTRVVAGLVHRLEITGPSSCSRLRCLTLGGASGRFVPNSLLGLAPMRKGRGGAETADFCASRERRA